MVANNAIINPFPVQDYISSKYFCDRKKETEKIISAFANNRNVTLISLRRIGKTALLKHVLAKVDRQKNTRVLYFDILPTESLSDFIKEFSEAIIKDEKSRRGFLAKITDLISAIRGKLVFDDISGVPSVEISISDITEATYSLKRIFEYLANQKEKYIIAIDEFQQISNYPEKNVEAILRTLIQHQHKDNFIFSGSSKHTLSSMFSSHGKPFYQSSDILELDRIDTKTYAKFIKKHFERADKIIELDLVNRQIENYKNHTFYVQYFFNRLFEKTAESVTVKNVNDVAETILKEREYVFFSYRNLLSSLQFDLLIAIAKEGGVKQINSGKFLKKYDFSQASSVSSAIKALVEKEMIFFENEKYQIYDVYFEKWLQKTY